MQKLKSTSPLLLIILGIILFLGANLVMGTITWILGLGLIVYSFVLFASAAQNKKTAGDWITPVIQGLLAFTFGILLLVKPGFLSSVIGLLMAVYGVLGAVNAYRQKGDHFILLLVLNGIVLVCGIIVVLNPFHSMDVLVKAIGGAFVYMGIVGLLDSRQAKD